MSMMLVLFLHSLFTLQCCFTNLLPTGSGGRELLGVESIPVTILPSCQDMKILHHNWIDMNIVG